MAHTRDRDWLDSANLSPDDFETEEAGQGMTDDQARRLEALCRRSGETFDPTLTRDQAKRKITELERGS